MVLVAAAAVVVLIRPLDAQDALVVNLVVMDVQVVVENV